MLIQSLSLAYGGRNIYDSEKLKDMGFKYAGMGRG